MSSAISASTAPADSATPARTDATLDGELAKCESQLADWVHCPSGKTSAGKARIAEITTQRDAIKVRIESREMQTQHANEPAAAQRNPDPPQRLQFSGLGTYLDRFA